MMGNQDFTELPDCRLFVSVILLLSTKGRSFFTWLTALFEEGCVQPDYASAVV